MIAWISFFLTSAVELFSHIFFYDSFMQHRWTGVRKFLSCVVLYVFGIMNSLLFETLYPEHMVWKMIPLIMVCALYIQLCYRVVLEIAFYFAGAAEVMGIMTSVILFGCVREKYGEWDIAILGACILSILLCIGITALLRLKLKAIKTYLSGNRPDISKIGIIQFLSVVAGLYYYLIYIQGTQNRFHIYAAMGLLIINIISLFILQDSLIKSENLKRSERLIESKENIIKAFQNMQSLYEHQGRKLHDYKKQLSVVQELLKNGNTDRATDFIELLTKSIAVEMSEVNVGHPVINAVLNQQYRIAKEKNIGMTFSVSDIGKVKLTDDEIVVVIGNLLENAVKECEKVILSGKSATVQVKLSGRGSCMVFTVKNPVMKRVVIEDNIVKEPLRQGHGMGLKNVSDVVDKYDGSLVLSCDDDYFTAVVMI